MADANKVKFGIKNVYYSVATVSGGAVSYGTPKAWAGAVSIDLSPAGDIENFYADNMVYFASQSGGGYSGTLTMAYVPDAVRKDLFGETVDNNDLLVESAGGAATNFALLFEFSGDANEVRHVLYNCTAGKPSINSETIGESQSPVTAEINLTATANVDGYVKASADEGATTSYGAWYSSVQVPSF